jgi:hypothetical protein
MPNFDGVVESTFRKARNVGQPVLLPAWDPQCVHQLSPSRTLIIAKAIKITATQARIEANQLPTEDLCLCHHGPGGEGEEEFALTIVDDGHRLLE